MKYKISDNYGKRAYIGLEELKKDFEKRDNVQNISKKLKFRVLGNDLNVVKNIKIKSSNILSSVKFYINNVTNVLKLKIFNNSILIFDGNVSNNIYIPIKLVEVNNLTFQFSQEAVGEFDILIEIVGEFLDIYNKTFLDKINDKFYQADMGLGETIVTIYDSLDSLKSHKYNSYYIVPLILMDAKFLVDSNCFNGKNLVILGINSIGKLSYKVIGEDLLDVIELPANEILDACLLNYKDEKFEINYISKNKIFSLALVDDEWQKKEINLFGVMFPCRLVSYNLINGDNKQNIIFAVQTITGNTYICFESGYNNQDITFRLLGKLEAVNICVVNDKIYSYLINEYNTKLTKLECNSNSISIALIDTVYPVDNVFNFGDNIIFLLNNFFTVVSNDSE